MSLAERIYFVVKISQSTLDLYRRLKHEATPSWDDLLVLDDLHIASRSYISKYYAYLDSVGISTKDSFVTKWLDECSFADYYDDIECFLKIYISRI